MGNQYTKNVKPHLSDNNTVAKKIDEISNKNVSSEIVYKNNPNAKLIKSSDLTSVFKKFCIDGLYLNYERFNDCISFLLKFDIPLICYTHLAEKLFSLMDKVILTRLKSEFRWENFRK